MTRLVDRVRRRLGMRVRDPEAVPPPPAVRLVLAGAVPGAVVRLLPSALVLLAVALAAPHPVLWLGGLAAAVLVAWRPAWPTVPVLLLVLGVWLLGGEDRLTPARVAGGGLLAVAALVAVVHLLVRMAALSTHVTWDGLVEVPVLLRLLRSVAGMQVVVQALVLATVWLRGNLGLSTLGQGWVRLVAAVAVVAVVLVVLPRPWLVRRPPRIEESARYD
ncbi:hypothetical protein GXB85_11095 [Cellulomonas sp. APG4]|uniref:hypothetical protein n=1 Tax=Cellulomonas sp. APG4 TaxID=1538656 RepID=UPI00137B13F6|nr:hypothetical protein [Cellulomonas sp. APG4]NCT91493.1 hypothetical protein [Cellulomonas sp. APG4]